MLRSLRERLTLALIALLPFHALFITVATKLIAGPGHAPLGPLAIWKEALLGLIVALAIVEILIRISARAPRHRPVVSPSNHAIDVCIICLLLISLTTSY